MNINLTLILQIGVFAFFVWFTMRFVWPPLAKALEERQNKIADGLAQAERGRKELELAQYRAKDELKKAKIHASEIIDKANHRASQLIEEAKAEAKLEAQKQAKLAQEQLRQEINYARASLHKEVAQLAIAAAQHILMREIDKTTNSLLVDNLIKEI